MPVRLTKRSSRLVAPRDRLVVSASDNDAIRLICSVGVLGHGSASVDEAVGGCCVRGRACLLGKARGVKRRRPCPPMNPCSVSFAGFRFPPEVIRHCCIEADGVRVVQARGSIRASGASPLIFHGGFQAVTLGPSDAGCWLARLNATVPAWYGGPVSSSWARCSRPSTARAASGGRATSNKLVAGHRRIRSSR